MCESQCFLCNFFLHTSALYNWIFNTKRAIENCNRFLFTEPKLFENISALKQFYFPEPHVDSALFFSCHNLSEIYSNKCIAYMNRIRLFIWSRWRQRDVDETPITNIRLQFNCIEPSSPSSPSLLNRIADFAQKYTLWYIKIDCIAVIVSCGVDR